MIDYLRPLPLELQQQANADQAGPMQPYLRDQFPFLGIKTPQRQLSFVNF